MGEIESLILLLGVAVIGVRLADLASIPYPIVLVIFGLAVGFVPSLGDVELDPDVVFLVFLPPLLHSAGWAASPRELKAEVRPLAMLSIALVLLTMAAVAVVAHAIVPDMGWPAAFVLGAIVGPTDPVSAAATFSRIGVPGRVRRLVEGEAMINDGTALVAYSVALTAALEGTFSPCGRAARVRPRGGRRRARGPRRGLGRAADRPPPVRRHAEHLRHPAGRLRGLHRRGGAARLRRARRGGAGIYGGWNAPAHPRRRTRLAGVAFWQVMVFGLEALLFVLLGLQAPQVAEEIDIAPLAARRSLSRWRWWRCGWHGRFCPPVGAGDSARERIAVGWSGMRGAISLAAALAVSTQIEERPEILLITFGVIAVTLLGQGLTLPLVLRALKLPGENRWSPDEARVRLDTAQAALDRLDELEDGGRPGEAIERLRDLYRARFAQCVAALGGGGGGEPPTAAQLRRPAPRRHPGGAARPCSSCGRGRSRPTRSDGWSGTSTWRRRGWADGGAPTRVSPAARCR